MGGGGGGVQFWNAGILCRNNPSRCCMINGRAQCAIQTMNLKQGLGGLIPLPHLLSCVYGSIETSEHTYTHTYIHDIIEKSKWYSVSSGNLQLLFTPQKVVVKTMFPLHAC